MARREDYSEKNECFKAYRRTMTGSRSTLVRDVPRILYASEMKYLHIQYTLRLWERHHFRVMDIDQTV